MSSFDESFFISDEGSDFDDFTEHSIFHDSQRLLIGYTSADEFDDVSGFDDWVGVPGFFGGSDDHGAFEEVEFELDAVLHEFFFDDALTLLDVFLSILGEEDGEAALLEEGLDLLGFDLLDFPVVDVVGVPGFLFTVFFGFGDLHWVLLSVCWHVIIYYIIGSDYLHITNWKLIYFDIVF